MRRIPHAFRRTLILVALLAGIVSPGLGRDLKRVVLLETMVAPLVQENTHWFLTEFRELGYEEGKNLHLIRLNAKGDVARGERLLEAALAYGKPDLVVTNATLASKVALKLLQGTGIPQVFFVVADPVGAGLIQRIAVPTGTNVTGLVYSVPRETKIALILQLIGNKSPRRPIRFGYLHSTYPSALDDLKLLTAVAAQRQDVVFVPYTIPYRAQPEGVETMIQDAITGLKSLEGRVDFLWQAIDAISVIPKFTAALLQHSPVPVVYGSILQSVKMGALAYIEPDAEVQGRETARLAHAILTGTPPGTIPPVAPSKIQFGLNQATAIRIRCAIPSDILELAQGRVYQ